VRSHRQQQQLDCARRERVELFNRPIFYRGYRLLSIPSSRIWRIILWESEGRTAQDVRERARSNWESPRHYCRISARAGWKAGLKLGRAARKQLTELIPGATSPQGIARHCMPEALRRIRAVLQGVCHRGLFRANGRRSSASTASTSERVPLSSIFFHSVAQSVFFEAGPFLPIPGISRPP
jgi:hypothetical protein